MIGQHQHVAGADWDDVPFAQEMAKHAVKMEAALRMVLMFYKSNWDAELREKWKTLQASAGIEHPIEEATTRVMCDTIRDVLGEPL
jgi:hypothetical protein